MKSKYVKEINDVLSDKDSFFKMFTVSLGISHFTKNFGATLMHSLKWTVRDMFLEYPAVIKKDNKSKILFINTMPISMRGPREDYEKNFSLICDLVNPKDVIYLVDVDSKKTVGERIRERFSIRKAKRLLPVIPSFLNYAKKYRMSITEMLYCLPDWINLCDFMKTLEEIDLLKYNLVVTFCDAEPRQHLIALLTEHIGCKTATMQHGMFCAPMEGATNAEEEGIELKAVVSSYFLAWNGLTKDYAIKTGIDRRKIIILGNPKFNVDNGVKFEKQKSGYFGVVLGNLTFDQDNRELIKAANEAAKELGMKYMLKYHPVVKDTYYSEAVDSDYYEGNVKRGISLIDYANSVEFSIVGQSSMLVELIHVGHPTYHLHSDAVLDKFELACSITFTNGKELSNLWRTGGSVTVDLSLYLSGPQEVAEKYAEFFGKFA